MSIFKADTKTGKIVYAAIVIIFAIVFPVFLFQSSDISEIKIDVFTVWISIFYFVAVIGFVVLIFNIKGVRLKVLETDDITREKINKFYLVISIFVILNLVYLSTKMLFEL
ncbi:MAG: hypothetical protein AB2551_15855 [Candidatus Thiodiazotropha sp.]